MATTKKTVRKARKLRRTMSPPEVMLWQILRRKPLDIKFRRQHPIGPYVLDFYCASVRLAIEIDGIAHDMGNRPERDQRRETYLFRLGVETIRIPAQDVLADVAEVADRLVQYVAGKRYGPSTKLRLVPLPIASQQGGLEPTDPPCAAGMGRWPA